MSLLGADIPPPSECPELSFSKLIRIEGTFEGRISCTSGAGSIVVTESGVLLCKEGGVDGVKCVVCDGKLIGNLEVDELVIRGRAFVHGNRLLRESRAA